MKQNNLIWIASIVVGGAAIVFVVRQMRKDTQKILAMRKLPPPKHPLSVGPYISPFQTTFAQRAIMDPTGRELRPGQPGYFIN